ncbi:MAG: DNA primase noncatalytic subunit PriX [Nitrososphaerota archaeon]|nr:DNA primase noncatalytic subunit PriX [Nitrososphaerota archaeon]MDG6943032.1 DNA primase noncatalytic subunit PriX [Nitrososphaerota archaeon]MDG6950761.1 DNA primase noncatalytic subunit PriX [Nitrososphaerota archaeon]
MPYGTSLLSDLEVRYPFAPRSRKFFETIPMEESFASKEVIAQAQSRLMNALGRARYEPSISELVEFSSFFAAAFVASQDSVLASRFSKKEGEKAKGFFISERPRDKAAVMVECFGAPVQTDDRDDGRPNYSLPFERYLLLISKYELSDPKWRLARQELDRGTVRLSDNLLNDLFGGCAQAAVADGIRNLSRASLPKQLGDVKAEVIKYAPSPRPKTNKGYLYVENLLAHPVADGRHRLTWLVLAPYLVNVKKLEDEAAIEKIRAFVAVAGETSAMRRFIEYNVRRARRNGLLPPTFSKLKSEHPDICALLPKEVLAAGGAKEKTVS